LTQTSTIHWQPPDQLTHWLKHSVLPLLVLAMVLALPHPGSWVAPHKPFTLTLELIEDHTPDATTASEPTSSTTPEPVMSTPTDTPAPPPVIAETIEPTPPSAAPPKQATDTRPSQINTGDILRMIEDRTSIEITPEFEARSGPATDFFMPTPQVTDWYADIPYLDETVDQPQLELNFYAEGFEGSIERFFDRITVTKTFTTKYGTKIHCAWIGVLVSCAWK